MFITGFLSSETQLFFQNTHIFPFMHIGFVISKYVHLLKLKNCTATSISAKCCPNLNETYTLRDYKVIKREFIEANTVGATSSNKKEHYSV